MIHLFLAAAMLLYGFVALRRDHSPTGRLYGSSFVAGCFSLALWPPHNAVAFDLATGVPGLARLLNDGFAVASVILQFAFISTLTNQWSRWRRVTLGLSIALLVALAPLWFAVRVSGIRDIEQVFYLGYYSRPAALLAWNLTIGMTITCTCLFSFLAYVHALKVARTRFTQTTTTIAIAVYAVAAIYGVLIVAQLVADRLGYGQTGVLRYTTGIVLICVAATLASTGVVVFGQPLRRYVQQWFSLSCKQARLNQMLKDNINANVLSADQRVYLERHADRPLIQAVDARCRARHLSAYRRKVARQATRLLILDSARLRPTESTDDSLSSIEEGQHADEQLLADLSRRIEEDLTFFADVYRVARLVILSLEHAHLSHNPLPELVPRLELPGWRHEVAELIVSAVRERYQAAPHPSPLEAKQTRTWA